MKQFILAKDVKTGDVIFFNNSKKQILRVIKYVCNNESCILLSYTDNRKFNKLGHKNFEPLNRLIKIN